MGGKYAVKLTPAKAGNFTCGLHVNSPHTHFTSVTYSLPVQTGKITRIYPARTSSPYIVIKVLSERQSASMDVTNSYGS